ncbi:MAG: hypothetical protein P1U64_03065 [Alcanivoracaceae bacterium]|nr:hypothetical protein [Alcanivoracaceae bacterium]
MTGDGIMARLLVRAALLLTLVVAAAALSVIGLVWLVNAMTLWLSPLAGPAAAHALAGLAALLPLLLVFVLLSLLARQTRRHAFGDGLRQSVRNNPWESLGMAFFLGFTRQGRHPGRTDALLALLRTSGARKTGPTPESPSDDTSAANGR